MAEELNPQVSSQPASTPSATPGPNAVGKPADAASPTMTPSQQSDYYNKTQQLASERKALDAERSRLEEERNSFRQGQGYGGNYQPQPQGYPQGQPQGNGWGQAQPQPLITQDQYSKLAREIGVDAANAHVETLKQAAMSMQGQLAMADARLSRAEMMSLRTQIEANGRDAYGDQWKDHGAKVMDHIGKTGDRLDYAWFQVVHGGSFDKVKQEAIDQAYRGQAGKEAAQVNQSTVQPSGAEPTEFNSVGDAFSAAWKQHSA